tara:strand:- start:350 stop:1060 length:711 start_codon:yes stop_codon:yes gene_type:complete
MSSKILLVIPTLNEYGNIQTIYKKIQDINKKINILFIDDNSIDGSKNVIVNLKKKNKKVNYIFREKKLGIGSAHKLGLKLAKRKKYRYVCTMDCDGTHDPRHIKKMLNKIKNSDLVITNRFSKKNSLKGWNIKRIIITKLRYYLVWILLGTKLDGSGGFRLYDLKKVKLKDILESKDNNYNFFWESTFLLEQNKYNISEIPIKLPNRAIGSSKMKLRDLISGILNLIKFFIKYKIL